ncbi:hypothetical protein ES708_17569 [subsurface metagenome]
MVSSGIFRYPSLAEILTVFRMDIPEIATFFSSLLATFSTCCILCICDEKVATIILFEAFSNFSSSVLPTSLSGRVNPISSALVLSHKRASTPSWPALAIFEN